MGLEMVQQIKKGFRDDKRLNKSRMRMMQTAKKVDLVNFL